MQFYRSIGIAGLPRSGKTTLLEGLRVHPHFSTWASLSTGDILRTLHNEHMHVQGRAPSEESFRRYLNALSDDNILALNHRALLHIRKGEAILDSRYAVVNCRNVSSALKVFLHAPLEVRIERYLKKNPGGSVSDIREDLMRRERWEAERGKRIYDYDYRDQTNYDLNLDTSQLTVEQEIEKIASFFTGILIP